MRVVSVNVGLPREIEWKGKIVTTAIFKEPVEEAVMLRSLNLDGDKQADLSVHGGVDKAVYAYPAEHYDYWRDKLPEMDLPWGAFGENFTTEGLFEDVHIGDCFRIGEAELKVTQPRLPCYKLGVRFGRADMVKMFLASRRTGFYLAVVRGGMVGPGDRIELIDRDHHGLSVADITRVFAFEKDDLKTLRLALTVEALPESWRSYFEEQIEKQSR
ncbi:MAG TPA: MOSC domain-containing protein [Blastocatellia bacterium]|nr:MOSC domain-containing protein [Blastocatellia bacterium]